MVSVARRQTSVMLVLLLVCMLAAALLACQGHSLSAEEHEHSTPLDYHHGPSSSVTGHSACLLAVLPAALYLVPCTYTWCGTTGQFVLLTPPVLPLFIPPKPTVR